MGSPISVENGTSLLISRQQCMPRSKEQLEPQEILETVEHKLSDEATISSDSQNVNGFSLGLDLCKKTREICSPISVENGASLLINRQQCMLLSKKLLETQEMMEKVEHELSDEGITISESPDVSQLAQELVHVLKAAHETVVKDCTGNGKWIESALQQGGDSKEAFGEILYDLQWYTFLMHTFFKWPFPDRSTLEPADCDGKLIEADDNMLLTAARQDQEELKVLLNDLKGNHACDGKRCTGKDISRQCLATQLLNKLEFQDKFQAWPAIKKMKYLERLHEVNNKLSQWPLVLLVPRQDLQEGILLGEGSYGRVHETIWLGETYAMKTSRYGYMEVFKQEIAALACLHHPHIMCLLCCAEEEMKCLYIMERMDKSLSGILEDRKLSQMSQMSLIRQVDLMLQIAKGMNYLHSMDLVHRDLKPDNILVKCDKPGTESSILAPEPFWIAKICDFGNTKAKMESTVYNEQTINIGTTMFMAPELYSLELGEEEPEIFHPKKTDVYSFGLLCLAVLIGEPTPFPVTELIPSKTFKDGVRKGKRPKLPPNCPVDLCSLIQQCWDGNPDKRPDFHDICTRLRYIKGLQLLTGEGRPSLDDIVTVAQSNRMAKSSSSQVLLEEQGTSGSQGVVPAKTMGEGMSTRDDNVVMEPRTVTSSSSHLLVQEQGTSTSQGGGMSTPNDNVVTEPRMEAFSNQALIEEEGTSSCLCCCWR
ncbi:unnamed protein product [Sphagnum troendelagicum]|uniref:Protein kinase domain-containing protein n=1 Tax=Sphagnum troendelagicum TaxID=128251 RepID=A0ABP0U141_9BRYO